MAKRLTSIVAIIGTALLAFSNEYKTLHLGDKLQAFPGAEGFGAYATGGRGGKVVFVDNLNDSGPGSFRAACELNEKRIIIFRVGGRIRAESPIRVCDSATIAGQTAPGDGICLSQYGLDCHKSQNIIVRGMRIRIGDIPWPSKDLTDEKLWNLAFSKECIWFGNNQIYDHCSSSWSVDKIVDGFTKTGKRDVTFQWCIFSEALYNSWNPKGHHSRGPTLYYRNIITFHHNLFAYNAARNPLTAGGSDVEIINNVGGGSHGAIKLRDGHGILPTPPEIPAHELNRNIIVGNYYNAPYAIRIAPTPGLLIKAYVKDNICGHRKTDDADEWFAVNGHGSYRTFQPPFPPTGVKTQSAKKAYQLVLKNAGTITPQRDAVDKRIIHNIQEKRGRIINSQSEVGGWPVYETDSSPLDSDQDGMPDLWEVQRDLNPNDPTDCNRIAPNGYTYIEEYINSLIEMPY